MLFLAIIPVMVWNVRRFREQERSGDPPCQRPSDVGRSAVPKRDASGSGGWFVRITILVVVVLWLIPALGVLITSFRPEALADTTGWWTVPPHLFDSSQWTLENYRTALDSGGF